MKKYLLRQLPALFIALCLLLGMLCLPAFAAGKADASAKTVQLKYNANGKFKILEFTDTHWGKDFEPKTNAFMNEALDYAKPDLVVFNGDNAPLWHGEAPKLTPIAIAQLIKPVVDRGLPFAFVFGNHEYQSKMSMKDQLAVWQAQPGCLTVRTPGLHGYTNFNLPIYSADGAKVVNNLFFLDSGTSLPGGHEEWDWVRKNQIDWYLNTSRALEKAAGHKVPSLLFQHIIVPEIYDLAPKAPAFLKDKLNAEVLGTYKGVLRFRYPVLNKIKGTALDHPAAPHFSDGEFDAIAGRGDVMAMIFGHDHANCFTANIRGVDLVQTPGTGFETFGANVYRGATLFTLNAKHPNRYQSKTITYLALSMRPGSQIGNPMKKSESNRTAVYAAQVLFRTMGTIPSYIGSIICALVRGYV